MVITFNVKNQLINRTDNNRVVARSKNYLYARFSFLTPEWEDIEKTAIFTASNGMNYGIALDTSNVLYDADLDAYKVPWEFLDKHGIGKVTVFAGNLVTANAALVNIEKTGYSEDISQGTEPSPTLFEQLVKVVDTTKNDMLRTFNGISGKNNLFDTLHPKYMADGYTIKGDENYKPYIDYVGDEKTSIYYKFNTFQNGIIDYEFDIVIENGSFSYEIGYGVENPYGTEEKATWEEEREYSKTRNIKGSFVAGTFFRIDMYCEGKVQIKNIKFTYRTTIADLDAMNTKVTNLDKKVDANKTELEKKIDTNTNKLSSDITALDTKMSQNVANINQTIAKQRTDIDNEIKDSVIALYTKLSSSISSVDDKTKRLEKSQADLNADIKGVTDGLIDYGKTLKYDEKKSKLYLMNGDIVLSEVTVSGGGGGKSFDGVAYDTVIVLSNNTIGTANYKEV